MKQQFRETELGRERMCSQCGEYWPDDGEFFYTKRGKTAQPCKACYEQIYRPRKRLAKLRRAAK